jgi:serine/threonine-protein kinase HipA
MSVNAKFVEITLDDFRLMGDRLEGPDIERSLREVRAAIERWPDFAALAQVDRATTEKIAADLRELRPQ